VPALQLICPSCGEWIELVDGCPKCGAAVEVERQRLWFVAGSSGSGKTTLMPLLRERLPECVVFECEAVHYWLFSLEPGYASLHNQWLQVAYEIARNGRPTVLVGTAEPATFDAQPSRGYFERIEYLGLVCDAVEQEARLRARPAWRNSAEPEFMRRSLNFTARLRELAEAGEIAAVDTTGVAPEQTADAVAAWVRGAG
jgi:energy-coupling factor transporter ATP-binding protein EcfA2